MRYLVDANVLSEATKPEPEPQVLRWVRDHEADLAIDPIILGEIRFGILQLSNGRRRKQLESWFEEGIGRIHCLDWDRECGLAWAALLAKLRRTGRSMPLKDSMIATSALVRSLTIATRNVADFAPAGVPTVNPFPSG